MTLKINKQTINLSFTGTEGILLLFLQFCFTSWILIRIQEAFLYADPDPKHWN